MVGGDGCRSGILRASSQAPRVSVAEPAVRRLANHAAIQGEAQFGSVWQATTVYNAEHLSKSILLYQEASIG